MPRCPNNLLLGFPDYFIH